MFRRSIVLLAVLLAPVSAALADGLAPINYTLRFTAATAHYVDVEADIPTDGHATVTLFMPVWTPGSYLVREFSKNIVSLSASSTTGETLAIEKTAKNRWVLTAPGQERVRVHYRIFGREISVRGNWIERDFAMLNGAPTFLTVAENYQRPYTVRLEMPAHWHGSYTPLAPGDSPNTYNAPDFDTLVDSPLLAGSPLVDSFEVDGVRHTLVTLGGDGIWDNPRATRNLARLVEEQRTFWGGLPYRTPYYFFNLLTGTRGGLEHKNSLVITADRWLARNRSGLNSWLSLASHEYFHVWNGKRLRPAGLGPFNYEHETYTQSLWVVEGITSYYQHVLLHRAGFNRRADLLGMASSLIASVQRTPGRLVQSLSASSYDTWIKAYRPDENSVNTTLSYYTGGSLAALLLDAEIRRVSNDAKSLDDVMRAAYARYSGATGYTEAQFIALTSEVAGHDLSAWFQRVVQAPGQWDYQPMLDWYGLAFEQSNKTDFASPNGIESPDPRKGWLGADTKSADGRLVVTSVRDDTPAATAGLCVDDEIIAIDQYRVSAQDLPNRLAVYAPGEKIALLISRRDQLVTLPLTLGEEPRTTWRIKVRSDATDAQKAHLRTWIGEDTPAQPTPAGS